ncbi:MAG: helix-turn-helix transcriptional regulator [Cyanobacteria bacterium Co-bin13]|nr:helix-turn-helix transcriptional regulator [Cyanobacteria bacterium Co-bin13]
MRPISQPCVSVAPIEPNFSFPVLDIFKVEQHQYLVICLSSSSCPVSTAGLPGFESASLTEISRFEVNGQPCAVVKLGASEAAETTDLTLLLTERELQIATLVALGRPNKQIASHLRISEWTVSTHLRRIFIKLGVDSRAAMVYRCAALIQQLNQRVETVKP